MAFSTGSQTGWWSESDLQRPGLRYPEDVPHPTSPVTTPSQPALIVLKTGDEASELPAVSPYGSRTVGTFFIAYLMHTSLANPLPWSSSLMVSLLHELDFRNVGRYLLHEVLSRAKNPAGSSSSGVILQCYSQSMLTKMHLQWWSDFERRLDTGLTQLKGLLMRDSVLLLLQPDSKTQERGLKRYGITETDPNSLTTCFEDIRQLYNIPFVESLPSNMLHENEELRAVKLDLSQVCEHLANFRNVQTKIRHDSKQSVTSTRQPRAGDPSKMSEQGSVLDRQIQRSRDRLLLQSSDTSAMPRWARQMHDDRHKSSSSSTHAGGASGRDRHISMSNETFFSSKTHDSKDTFVTASEGLRSSGSFNCSPTKSRQRS